MGNSKVYFYPAALLYWDKQFLKGLFNSFTVRDEIRE